MRPVRAVVLAAAAALAVLVGTPGAGTAPPTVHLATAGDDATISWSVVPGDAAGSPDGRRWVELSLGPGDTVTQSLVITNHGATPAEFRLTAADGYFTDTGRFTMLPSDRLSTDAGTWIDVASSVELAGGETRSVPFTVRVPDDATPGDHLAGVAAGITTGSGEVGVESRVGFRVMTRVTGALTPEARTSTELSFDRTWNPFRPGVLTVTYTIHNTGNTRLGAAPVVQIDGPFGVAAQTVAGEAITELAPGESRTSTVTVRRWPLVIGSVAVRANPTVVAVDGGATVPVLPSTATATVATLPVGQAALALTSVLLVLLWTRDRRARRRRVEDLVAAAREEGRLESSPSTAEHPARPADLRLPRPPRTRPSGGVTARGGADPGS